VVSRTRVIVLFGGRSVEREVSRLSARTIAGALDPSRYEVVPLAVGKEGRFLPAAESARLLAEGPVPEKFRAGEGPPSSSREIVPAQLRPGKADVVFPIIHGTTGEDGSLQGFLEILDLPYVGAGVTGSAVGMDKAIFKALLRDAGIPTPRSIALSLREWGSARGGFQPRRSLRDRRLRDSNRGPKTGPAVAGGHASRSERPAGVRGRLSETGLSLPLFVKPSNGGSSVGVSKVKRWKDLDVAIRLSFRYDDRILIEEGIDARELECAVLGNDEPRASLPGEVVPGREFYDYDDKYREDKAKLLIPAPVSEAVSAETRRLAVEVFLLCGISGMARVDFFLERGTDRLLVSEINTLPGFTAISMYPKLWEASGLPLSKLLDELIRLAFERKKSRASLSHEPPAELG
jgi:D-alanine-D-alanine ligase